MKTMIAVVLLAVAFAGGLYAQSPPPAPVEVLGDLDALEALIELRQANTSLGTWAIGLVQEYHAYVQALPTGEVRDAMVEIDLVVEQLNLEPLLTTIFDTPNATPTPAEFATASDWVSVLAATMRLAEVAQGN